MVKVQKAEQSFLIETDSEKTTLTFFTSPMKYQTFSLILGFLFCLWVFVFLIATMWVAIDKDAPSGSWIWIFIHAGIAYFLYWNYKRLKHKKSRSKIYVSKHGIDIEEKRYPFSDIDDISCRFGKDGMITNSNTAAASYAHFEETSGVIEIGFGNKRVSVAKGLRKNEVEKAYLALKGAMEEHGYISKGK